MPGFRVRCGPRRDGVSRAPVQRRRMPPYAYERTRSRVLTQIQAFRDLRLTLSCVVLRLAAGLFSDFATSWWARLIGIGAEHTAIARFWA